MQRAQAMRDGKRLQAYEFLHATFGEYLAARLAIQLTASLLAHQDAITVGPAVIHDDLLYALLSFAPLSSRQMLRFAQGASARQVAPADRDRLAGLLIDILTESTVRTDHRHANYRPVPLAISSRHAIYSANLVLLIAALRDHVKASDLFPGSADPAGAWNRRALLWRSALTEPGWTDLALALSIRHTWKEAARDLEIRLSHGRRSQQPEPVDPYWLYRHPPGDKNRGQISWYLAYWEQVNHKMDVAGGTNDSVIRHAVEPWFTWLGPAVTSFSGIDDGPATSLAHDLLTAWLSSTLSGSHDPVPLYERLKVYADGLPPWSEEVHRRVQELIISCLRADASRLPAPIVIKILKTVTQVDDQNAHLIIESALAALAAGPPNRR